MAVVINATPGGASSNSYLTLAEGDTYHEERLHSTVWENSDTLTKNTALVMATRLMDQMFVWDQLPTTETQALQWPRSGVLAANQLEYVGDYEIPPQLKWATAEFARQLITTDSTANSDAETEGLSALTASSVSLTWRDGFKPKVVPDAVAYLLPSWWYRIRGKSGGVRPLARA